MLPEKEHVSKGLYLVNFKPYTIVLYIDQRKLEIHTQLQGFVVLMASGMNITVCIHQYWTASGIRYIL